MRRFVHVAALGLLTIVFGIGPATVMVAGPAAAHAALVGTDPEDGAQLETLPDQVSFTFNEAVGNVNIAVQAPDGTPVQLSDVGAVDSTASATLADPEQQGTYTASYRVVSVDGHPIAGTVTFDVLSGEVVDQVEVAPVSQGFFDRHTGHIIWGTVAGLAAVALIVVPLRRRDDTHDA